MNKETKRSQPVKRKNHSSTHQRWIWINCKIFSTSRKYSYSYIVSNSDKTSRKSKSDWNEEKNKHRLPSQIYELRQVLYRSNWEKIGYLNVRPQTGYKKTRPNLSLSLSCPPTKTKKDANKVEVLDQPTTRHIELDHVYIQKRGRQLS